MVLASTPVASVMRLAARQVGAQSNNRTPLAARILRIELTIVVLPNTRPPSDHQRLRRQRQTDRRRLTVGELQTAPLFDPGFGLLFVDPLPTAVPRLTMRISRSAIACSAR